MGCGAAAREYRFQSTFATVLTPTDANDLYIGDQELLKPANDRRGWQVTSPALPRKEPWKQGPSGAPLAAVCRDRVRRVRLVRRRRSVAAAPAQPSRRPHPRSHVQAP